MAIVESLVTGRANLAGIFIAMLLVSGCATTSGSDRLDETGERMAEASTDSSEPEDAVYYIQALKGGLISRIADVKLSNSDRLRALEAEYKVLEVTPSGQAVDWTGSGLKGQVVAAVPYQVGSQNCRQYTHSLWLKESAVPKVVRGAACRNKNGTWTLL